MHTFWKLLLAASVTLAVQSKPNIVVIMSDDQDLRLGSTDFQGVLHDKIHAKGVEFSNHYATTANCCPGRTSFMRGQFVHNTNVTHVHAPGGNYEKFVVSGQDKDYLPFWLKQAGYNVEYLGKFLNGYNQLNYNMTPKGWDHIDALVDPYTYVFNYPVMSANGAQPVLYEGWHQSDVMRAKTLDRIEHLTSQPEPFFLMVAPTAPHIQNDLYESIPLARHKDYFANATAPRTPNYNPSDEFQLNKGSWVKHLPVMNESVQANSDHEYRQRIRALQGVDEIVQDAIALLENKGCMNNTYFIYTTDNGYHIGNHRNPAGKALFYGEDTNLPFAVRGPGIPEGIKSTIPSAHVDLVPTFLDIAGLPESEWPVFLDGQSILQQWHHPMSLSAHGKGAGGGNAKEVINIEFWGLSIVEAPNGKELGMPFMNTTYKTLRILGSEESWLYSYWCTGDLELYNTADDPYELVNLAIDPSAETRRLLDRLNAMLLVTKSCEQSTCRDLWSLLQPEDGHYGVIQSLSQAMDQRYDSFFASFPRVQFTQCLQIQDVENEQPFYPPIEAHSNTGLGREYRGPTDNYASTGDGGLAHLKGADLFGTWEQRNATLADIVTSAHKLTYEDIHGSPGKSED